MAQESISRRYFFYGALLTGAIPAAGFGSVKSLKRLGYKSPNERLNIGKIGAGGKGLADIAGCRSENHVAFADPDDVRAARAFNAFPKAPKYKDFRRMFDKEEKNIDAVVISIPDFMHGTAAMWAMERGKHVYCQKPLTRTVWEARELLRGAEKYKVATQMGNQGYSGEGARECCEMIWSGEIGHVTEVQAWTNRPTWPQGPEIVPAAAPVPATFDWDVWLGISQSRPYSPAYAPHHWRAFPEFGCGAIGDMACHILGTPQMALQLGNPTSVECLEQEGKSEYTFPKKSVIRYDFPARGSMPPVKVFWHDGLKAQPQIAGVPPDQLLGDKDVNGSVFIGDKGVITTGCYGERTRLMPNERMKEYKLPSQVLTRSPGHYNDWIRACKGGDPACSNFSVAVPFVEWMLLGVISMKFEGKLEWDASKMRFTNNNEANKYLKPHIRKEWKFV